MEQPLDLSITLTEPPQGSSPDTIASIELRCDQLGLQYNRDVLIDPLTPQERENLRWYLEEYPEWPYEQFLERGKRIEAFLVELGRQLYHAVFGSAAAMSVVQPWRLQPEVHRQISIVSEVPRALSLPWELLHDEHGFLVLRTRNPVALIRRLPQQELSAFSMPFQPPLRILLVTARPENAGFVDPRSIAREMLDAVQGQLDAGTIAVEFLRPSTLRALRERLSDTKRPPIHILHFDGHGAFGVESDGEEQQHPNNRKQGMLAFEDEDGKLDLVAAKRVAQVLQDSAVKLTVLTACQSAKSNEEDAFSSVAAQLIRSGIDAVTAMSASMLTATATRYAEAYYRSLAGNTSVPLAQERARQALHDDPRRDVHSRHKDDEGTLVKLQDWWVPHFYQQRPVVLQQQSMRKRKKPAVRSPSQRLSQEMPPQPRHGFSGRAHELSQIERYLLRGKLVVIHGFGGVGKTALAREAADWLTRTNMYEDACFVSFEHGGDAAMLLSVLGTSLNVYDGHYDPSDTKAALAKLIPALKEQRVLVISDNMESILPGGVAPLEAGTRSELWNVLLALANAGAGILLTGRDATFGDAQLAPGNRIAYLALRGLHPEDAYALASRLLADQGINRVHIPYGELRILLEQLDYHPLAIQLVLPTLRELSLGTIMTNFATLLSKFVDDTETGHNRSLLASLEYSLQRLSKEQKELLTRLAPFEGGAYEEVLLTVVGIPEADWVQLRVALEQAALLTVERVHEFVAAPFLHFHPVLIPFLRSQPNADNKELRTLYAECYLVLVGTLLGQDQQYPQPVRALVQRELPNLQRALDVLLEEGDEAATLMADGIAHFLNRFGLTHERNTLWKRVVQMSTTRGARVGEGLALTEYRRESDLGEEEFRKGNLRAAFSRFMSLLVRIEAVPAGTPFGRESSEHAMTLVRLARCLREQGELAAAENRLREALIISEALFKQESRSEDDVHCYAVLLTDLGAVLLLQGRYSQAQGMYEKALQVTQPSADPQHQAVVLEQLGTLAFIQQDYGRARSYTVKARTIFHRLNEPAQEADAWHQLGLIAQKQKEFTEAERCYRECLIIRERLGHVERAAMTCGQLGALAEENERPAEAEGWFKRALELEKQVYPRKTTYALYLYNLASLLVGEVQVGRVPMNRLIEAWGYAEQAQAIQETQAVSANTWKTFSILADIAEMEGRMGAARDYRRRERETYIAFEGNHHSIDRQFGELIAIIAIAARGNKRAREATERFLQQLEAELKTQPMIGAIRRLLGGERDKHSLTENLGGRDALLLLRMLEELQKQ